MSSETKFIFIDTNTWIYLADKPEYFEQLQKIKEILNFPKFKLVLPDSTKVEFERHKERILKSWKQRLQKQASSSIQVMKNLLPGRVEEFERLHLDAQNSINTGFAQIETNLKVIDELFSKAELLSIDHFMVEAGRRCLNHIAPAHQSTRSSTGDCLLWLSVIDYLDTGTAWLCTADSDFSSQKKKDELDETLKMEATTKRHELAYFNDINRLIESALPYKPKLPKFVSFDICISCGSTNVFHMTRTTYTAWYECLKCKDCGHEILIDVIEKD
jgi:DNA-directed RNA polymerase subunit RPC12/RpoP